MTAPTSASATLVRVLNLAVVCVAVAACSPQEADLAPEPVGEPIVVPYDPADTLLAELLDTIVAEIAAAPDSDEPRGRLGMAYEINDFKAAAIQSYDQAMRLNPAEFRWPYFRSQLLAEAGEYEAALDDLAKAIDIDPAYPPVWLWRASWLRNVGRFDESVVAFEKARELETGAVADIGMAQTFLHQNRAEEALGLLEPLESMSHPHIYRLMGQAYQMLGRVDDARIATARGRHAEPAQWRDPRHAEKWDYLASFGGRLVHAERLLEGGQFMEVIDVLEPMRQTHPDHEAILSNLAMAHGRTGNPETALAYIDHGFSVRPGYFRFYNVVASIRFGEGKVDQALEALEQSIELSPNQTWPYHQMATILMQQERFDEALEALDDALRHGYERPEELLLQAGKIEGAREAWEPAIERFRRATEIDPSATMAFVYLGRSYAEAGRFPEAWQALTWADRLETHPWDRRKARDRVRFLEVEKTGRSSR